MAAGIHIWEGYGMNKVVRWTPNGDWMEVHDEVNRLFDSLTHGWAAKSGEWSPAVDIRESGDEFLVRMDLPGLSAKDVKVSVFEDTLTVRGERRETSEAKDVKWHRVERFHGAFERRFQLGTAVQGDKVSAAYQDGVLEIRIPKAEQVKPREIPVQIPGN